MRPYHLFLFRIYSGSISFSLKLCLVLYFLEFRHEVDILISSTILELIDQYGYFIFFLAFALGPFGIPVPNEITILTGVFLCITSGLDSWITYLCILSGLLIAVTVSYLLGRFFEKRFTTRLRSNRHFQKADSILHRYGIGAMCIGFFIPIVRYIMPMLVGVSNIRTRTFVLISYSSALLWTALYFVSGTFLVTHIL